MLSPQNLDNPSTREVERSQISETHLPADLTYWWVPGQWETLSQKTRLWHMRNDPCGWPLVSTCMGTQAYIHTHAHATCTHTYSLSLSHKLLRKSQRFMNSVRDTGRWKTDSMSYHQHTCAMVTPNHHGNQDHFLPHVSLKILNTMRKKCKVSFSDLNVYLFQKWISSALGFVMFNSLVITPAQELERKWLPG